MDSSTGLYPKVVVETDCDFVIQLSERIPISGSQSLIHEAPFSFGSIPYCKDPTIGDIYSTRSQIIQIVRKKIIFLLAY